MSEFAERLCRRYYGNTPHPYRVFEDLVRAHLPEGGALLDAGCGRTAPVLQRFRGRAGRLVGADLVEFVDCPTDVELYNTDLARLPVEEASMDLVMSRSVFEHLERPDAVYRELARVLRPGGKVVFLTANVWDYATMVARIVPNRFHARIVARTEGRAEEDVFPTCYKSNSRCAVEKLAREAGLQVSDFAYLGQYPNYFMFNGVLFFLGTCYDKLVTRFDALRLLRGWILVTLTKPPRGSGS